MTILQALDGAYARFAKETRSSGKPRVPPYGFSYENIAFALVLDSDGRLITVDTVDAGELDVPSDPTLTRTSGIEPMFLWDKTAYVLGLAREVKKRTPEEHQAFKDRQRQVIGDNDDVGLRALLHFLEAWTPSTDNLPERYRDEVVGNNVVFRLDGEQRYLHDRPAAREAWLCFLGAQAAPEGRCLVTGEDGRIALTHPTIGGVRGAQSSGASIVSFNQEAFKSFGKDQGANASISERAAFAYTTVLNELLRKDSRNRIQLADATTVFWAEAEDTAEAEAAETLFALAAAPPDDADVTAEMRPVLKRMEDGEPLEAPELHIKDATRFYILGLSPNAARLSVRFWHQTTLGELGKRFHEHWRDLRMDAVRSAKPFALWLLLSRVAPARTNEQGQVKYDSKRIPPNLAGETMRAILLGGRYPGALLMNIVMRVRTDGMLDRIRVSLIKAAIVRAMRLDGRLPQEDYLMRTDPEDPNPARRLGRLFAVLERAQLAALGDKINTTIKDKFLGAAATTPGQVFVGLIKNSQHHTKRLRNGHADAAWIKDANHARRVGFGVERDIGRLWGSFNDGLPVQHSIEEQGLFLVGYYQERFGGKPDQQIGDEPGVDQEMNDDLE